MSRKQETRFSYVITYRSDQGMRDANLRVVLSWLSQIGDIQVQLVEQDRSSRVPVENLPSNCAHQFIYNSGPFNKSWGLNVGFKRSSGTVVGFGDADLLVNAAALIACYERCHNDLDAMKPYDELVDLDPHESRSFREGNWKVPDARRDLVRNREGIGEYVCFCGGLFLIRRGVYAELGGFDERFLGWGGEDDAMTSKLTRLGKRLGVTTNQVAYHLWHERSVASRYLHRHYRQNLALTKWYAACDTRSLLVQSEQDRQSMGRPDKYSLCNF